MEDLVSVDRHDHRRAKQAGAVDGHVRVLVLERGSSAKAGIGDLHDAVRRPRELAKDLSFNGNHTLERLPHSDARSPGNATRRVRRKSYPVIGDLRAVEIELSDEKRHVDQVVVIRRRELARSAGRYSGDDFPSSFGVYRY